jgi:hypothetical protein
MGHALGQMRSLTIACLAALTCAVPAAAQEPTWLFDDNPELTVLQYGAPDSDDVLFAISCEPMARRMRIVEFTGSNQLKPGGKATMKLTAGTGSLDLTGDTIANEMDGTANIEVTGPPNPRVFALLRGGATLQIEVPGAKQSIPLAAAAPHVAALETLCLGRR